MFAEPDALTGLLHAAIGALEELGQIDKVPERDDSGLAFEGYCARSCASYRYLIRHDPRSHQLATDGDKEPKIKRAQPAGHTMSHYWLELSDGSVLDLNRSKWDGSPRYPYGEGKGAPIRPDKQDPTLPASHDAQRIIAMVQAMLGAKGVAPVRNNR